MYVLKILSPLAVLAGGKSRKWYEGRRGIIKHTKSIFKESNQDVMWFHCASLGEFEQGRQLIEDMRAAYPNYKVLLTFFSPSGYEVRKNYEGADYVLYLPIDTPTAAKQFVRAIRPKLVVFVKYEFWKNMLKEAKNVGAQVYLVSGIFRESQSFFKWYGCATRNALRHFNHFFVQNQLSKDLLATIDIKNVTVVGDTRFDRVMTLSKNHKQIKEIEVFKDANKMLLVAGSTWEPDDEILIKIAANNRRLKTVIAPHELCTNKTQNIISKAKELRLKAVAFSQSPSDDDLRGADIFILDTIGLLSSAYVYGDIAYIGGGFGVGIHNTLEAATYGLPISFGSNYEKFAEAKDLIELGAAHSVLNFEQLGAWVDGFQSDRALLKRCSDLSRGYVESKVGASKTICEYIKERIEA